MPEQLVGAVDQVNLQMRLQDHCTELKPTARPSGTNDRAARRERLVTTDPQPSA